MDSVIYDPQFGWVWKNPDGSPSGRKASPVVYDQKSGKWRTLNGDGTVSTASDKQVKEQQARNNAGWEANDNYNDQFVEDAGPGMTAQGAPASPNSIVGTPGGQYYAPAPSLSAYQDSPEADAYEAYVRSLGTTLANRDDYRYSVDTNGMTGTAAATSQVKLGNAPQAAGVNLGSAPQVGLTNLGSAPTASRVNMGTVDQMGRVQLGPASQSSQLNLGNASTAQRVQLGQAAQAGRVDMGESASAGRVQLGNASTANHVELGNAAQMGRVDMGEAQQANLYTTNFDGAFDPSTAAYGYAGALNEYATNIDGTYLQDAAEMQRLAAMGLTPSAAENMYLQGGIDTQYALDRAAQQTQSQTTFAIDDLVRDQLSQAARARGSSGMGLATMNAQNQSALGSARIQAEALNQLQQNNLQYIATGQTAYNQAALTRANEMAQARGAYGDLGQSIRAGDFQGAQNALSLAQGYQSIDQAYLGASQQNTDWANANSQFNATNLNAFAQAQGQLDQQRNQANMLSQNDMRQQQGQLDAQLNQYNSSAMNQFALQQASMDLQRNQYNAGLANDWGAQQAMLDAQRNQYNASNSQATMLQQGQMDAQLNQYNSSTLNDWRLQQGQLAQQNNQFNATNANQFALQQSQLDAARNEANMMASNQWTAQQAQLDAQRNQFNAGNALNLQLTQGELDQQARLYNATNLQNQLFQQGQLTQQNNQYNTGLTQQQQFQQAQLSQSTNQFNAGQSNQMTQANLDRLAGLRTSNAQLAAASGVQDDALLGQSLSFGQSAYENDQAMAVRGQESLLDYYSHAADREANRQVGAATNAIQRQQIAAQQTGAIVGAGGALIGGLIASAPGAAAGGAAGSAAGREIGSDRRMKNLEGPVPPADFTRAADQVYTYKGGYGQEPGQHVGPMADELPEDVIKVKNGLKHVDIARLALREVGALGNLQKRVAQLESRK